MDKLIKPILFKGALVIQTKKQYSSPKDPSKIKAWKSLEEDVYRRFFSMSVTHSAKYKNTNVPGGVRAVAPSDAPLPGYIGYKQVRAASNWLGGLDYSKLETDMLTAASNVHAVMNGYAPSSAPRPEIQFIESMIASLSHDEVDVPNLNRRLAQLLVPSPDGQGYIAVTPLESGALSELFLVKFRGKKEAFFKVIKKEQDKTALFAEQENSGFYTRFPTRVPNPLGGGIPRNAGYFAQTYAIQSPVLCSFPVKNQSVASASSIVFKKDSSFYFLPKALMRKYSEFRTKHTTPGETFPSNLALREEEKRLVGNLARAALSILNANASKVCAHQSMPKIADRLSTLDPYARACLDPALRDSSWFDLFAKDVASKIANYREMESVGGQKTLVNSVNLSSQATSTIASWCHAAIIRNQGEMR